MAPTHQISACLFDMDGLLLDTESMYTVAQQQILDRFGKKFTWELKAKMMGRKALEASQLLVDELQLEGQITAQQYMTEREEILDVMFASAPLLPGVDRLVRHLHRHGVPIAVATSSHKRHYDLKTTLHRELFGLFNCVITGDQVRNSKPAPDIFLLAMQQLQDKVNGKSSSSGPPEPAAIAAATATAATAATAGTATATAAEPAAAPSTSGSEQLNLATNGTLALTPGSCLVFEDAPTGVEAGLAAGMKVVMVPDPQLDRGLCGKATLELRSLEDFDPAAWGLPPYPSK